MKKVRIGISGWTYPPWRKIFYPEKLAHHRELEFASREVTSIEINGSFYSLQRPESYDKWYNSTPSDFVFSIKANRYVTHIKRLRDIEDPMADFFASGPLVLKEKLGPFLWQFPPSMKFDRERFEKFLKLLPQNYNEAIKLAKKHTPRMKERSFIPPAKKSQNPQLRHAIEVRHDDFKNDDFKKLLKKYNVALVTADTAGRAPYFENETADFHYIRLHGDVEIYSSGYTPKALKEWAAKIKKWMKKKDVYVYFDNDIKVRAPFDALGLLQLVNPEYKPAHPLDYTKVKNLRTPGPRMVKKEENWRGYGGKSPKRQK